MSIFDTLAVGAELTHDGVRYKRDAVHGLVILDDNPPLANIDASQITSGVLDPARLPPTTTAWSALANNGAITLNGRHTLTAGNTLTLVDIGQGNECRIRLADLTIGWLAAACPFDVPAGWAVPVVPDPGPASILTIVCDTAALRFTIHG